MDDGKLEAIVLAATTTNDDGQKTLTCAEAFGLADEHGVDLLDIARVCNANGKQVRLTKCQLGCFP